MDTNKKAKRLHKIIAALVAALLFCVAVLGWSLWRYEELKQQAHLIDFRAYARRTAEYSITKSPQRQAYLLRGQDIFDKNWFTYGGLAITMPDILLAQYLVDIENSCTEVKYNFASKEKTQYLYFRVKLYDIEQPNVLIKEINVKELLEIQFPGYELYYGGNG